MYNHILKNENFVNLDEYFVLPPIYGRIYKITNLITNKIYIGQTTKSIEERFRGHIYNTHNPITYLHKAMNKYGVENFTVEEIDIAYSLDELNQKEYDWIIKENCLAPNGYNLKNGGYQAGYSEETRNKISQSHLGKEISAETRQKFKESMINGEWFHDPSTNKEYYIRHGNIPKEQLVKGRNSKHSENNTKYKTGYKHSEDTKSLMSKHSTHKFKNYIWCYDPINAHNLRVSSVYDIPEGYIIGCSPDSIKKRSESLKGMVWCHSNELNEEKKCFINDIPEGFILGRLPISKETRQKMSIASKQRSPETKEKRRKAFLGRKWYHDPISQKQIFVLPENVPDGFIRGKNLETIMKTAESKKKINSN